VGKKTSKSNPEALKEAGNRAFANGSFEESLKLYTQAIERLENPSHLYLTNRANAFLKLERNSECIDDCNLALKV
jgi:tetratricopeptide (TPR) repeat protein